MRTLKQSTAYDAMVFMADAADHVTGKTGLTLTITASKAGAAFGSISPTVTERGNGWYSLALTTSHTDTVGDLALHITASDADPSDLAAQVRANVLGDTLPAAVQSVAANALTASALASDAVTEIQSGLASQASVDDLPTNAELATALAAADDAVLAAVAALPVPLTAAGVRTAVGLATANLDTQLDALPTNAELSTALAAADDAVLAAVAALNNLDAAGIRAAVGLATANLDDQLEAIDAGAGGGLDAAGVRSAIGLASANLDTQLAAIDDAIDTEVGAIKLKTDNLPAAPAATGDIPSANAVADAILDRANGVETSLTLRQAMRLIAAAAAGKVSGAATTTVTIRNVGDTKTRITSTVTADGDRAAVTTDVS